MSKRMGCCIPGLSFPLYVALIEHVPYKNILSGFLNHPRALYPCIFLLMKFLGIYFFRIPPIFKILNASLTAMKDHL